MKKGSFISDTFEKLDIGEGAKKAVKPLAEMSGKMLESVFDLQSPTERGMEEIEKGQNTKKSTPLNFQKLQKKYADQDKQKTDALRQRLFQLVKSEEEKTVMKMHQEEMEEKQKELYEEQEKKRKVEEKKKQEQMLGIPQGKIRRSIFSHKKAAQREQTEVRPASGKQ